MNPICELKRVEQYRRLRNLTRELEECRLDGVSAVSLHARLLEREIERVRHILRRKQ